jgi:hypothetical protein
MGDTCEIDEDFEVTAVPILNPFSTRIPVTGTNAGQRKIEPVCGPPPRWLIVVEVEIDQAAFVLNLLRLGIISLGLGQRFCQQSFLVVGLGERFKIKVTSIHGRITKPVHRVHL